MAQLFANAARSTLTASITAGSTQLQINPADQALFPVATGADWFKVALEDTSGNLEFMQVQRAVGQSLLTISARATEDAAKFPARAFVAGSLVELRMTAADLASSIAHPGVASGAHAASAIAVTPAGGISATTVQAALVELDAEKQDKAGTFPYGQLTDAPKRWLSGEWVLTPDTVTPAGCVVPNGGTIGGAASGATNRANTDTADLFPFYWRITSNTDYPIQDSAGAASTRGASAAADFAANKRFPLPNIQDGDALVAAVSSAVLSRTAGANLSHTHAVTVDSAGDHSHSGGMPSVGAPGIPGGSGGSPFNAGNTGNAGAHIHAASATSSGGSKNLAAGLMTRVYIAL